MVLTGINSYWMSNLRVILSSLAASQDRGDWDFRYDDEDVCIEWGVETCRLLAADVFFVIAQTPSTVAGDVEEG